MKSYREKQSIKRSLISLGVTLLFHLILFSAIYLWENRRTDLELYSGPVRITLGEPEGQELPAVEPPQEESQAPQEQETPQQAEDTPPPEEPVPAEDSTPVETAPEDQQDSEEPPVEEESSDHGEESSATEEQEEPQPQVVRGQTYGNTHELYLDSTGGRAGRNLWTPIYLYMPLPMTLPMELPDGAQGDPDLGITPDDDRRVFGRYYRRSGGQWELKDSPVHLDSRPEIWIVLERMGYDLSKAEYKTQLVLKSVEIHFTISAVESVDGTVRTSLAEAEIHSSSGYEHIDQAVLHGFTRSSYYNDSDRDLRGRFVYRFR